jgi:hypothetical protein
VKVHAATHLHLCATTPNTTYAIASAGHGGIASSGRSSTHARSSDSSDRTMPRAAHGDSGGESATPVCASMLQTCTRQTYRRRQAALLVKNVWSSVCLRRRRDGRTLTVVHVHERAGVAAFVRVVRQGKDAEHSAQAAVVNRRVAMQLLCS